MSAESDDVRLSLRVTLRLYTRPDWSVKLADLRVGLYVLFEGLRIPRRRVFRSSAGSRSSRAGLAQRSHVP